jgi:hypothetical protein
VEPQKPIGRKNPQNNRTARHGRFVVIDRSVTDCQQFFAFDLTAHAGENGDAAGIAADRYSERICLAGAVFVYCRLGG